MRLRITSRGTNDCAISALAHITGVDYPAVVAYTARRFPRWTPKHGLRIRQIQDIAKALGTPLRNRRRELAAVRDGLIYDHCHIAILSAGQVIETDGNGRQCAVETWMKERKVLGVLVR